jgi:processive 1,2-diacylglycerol beta-glucosyltransferase
MISLHDKDSGVLIGTISELQLQFLIDELEEEGVEDQDYAITHLLLDLWDKEREHPELVELLRNALGKRVEMNLAWERG